MYKRILNLEKLLDSKSYFLLGPRATGKSWLTRNQLPSAQFIDLLKSDTYDRFLRAPHLLESELKSKIVVIDEIQKLPRLLDEVHRLIEEKGIRFLLTGSSARKLKRGGANLLAGRARSMTMHPLVTAELDQFDLIKYCNRGGLPLIYDSDQPWLDLKEYCHLYIKEEILAESIVRKVDLFARFLDQMGFYSGKELVLQKVASDSQVPVRTVDHFIEILKDTLIAYELEPYSKTKRRKSVSKTKLFIFDIGVANYLAGRKEILPRSTDFGIAFEHFITQEVRAYTNYYQKDLKLYYWRTTTGQYEVDLIVGDEMAIEIKSSEKFSESYLSGLLELKKEKQIKNYFLITQDPIKRQVEGIHIIPYSEFLNELWSHSYLT
jgi:predicted AAA+ superfamily ATPase